MYWFILLFPLLIYPWGYDPNYTMPKVVYLDLFVLGTWLYIVFKRKYWTINLKKPFKSVEGIIVIYFFLIIVSTLFSINKITSLYGTEHRYEGILTYFSYLSVFMFSYQLLDENKLGKIIPGMAVVSIFASVYGILQHYLLDFFPRNSLKILDPRSYSFFDNANFFGSYLVLLMMLTITLYLTEKNKKLNVFYFITISISFVALLFSQTRSGWVGAFIGILFVSIFVIVKRKFLWKKWGILLVVLALLMILINLTEEGTYSNRIDLFFSDSSKIVTLQSTGLEGSSRLFIWKTSLPLVKSFFWFGSGPDTFALVFPNGSKAVTDIFGNLIVDKAHNEYIQIAVTLGIPALITYLILLAFVIRRAFLAARITQGNDKIFMMGLIATILGYMAQAFFNISVVPVAPLFWAILGITLAKSELYIKKGRAQKLREKNAEDYQSA